MLTIKAEATAGIHLRDELLPEMLALANKLDVTVEVKANDTRFVVRPRDQLYNLQMSYDRYYHLNSTTIMSGMTCAWPRSA